MPFPLLAISPTCLPAMPWQRTHGAHIIVLDLHWFFTTTTTHTTCVCQFVILFTPPFSTITYYHLPPPATTHRFLLLWREGFAVWLIPLHPYYYYYSFYAEKPYPPVAITGCYYYYQHYRFEKCMVRWFVSCGSTPAHIWPAMFWSQ